MDKWTNEWRKKNSCMIFFTVYKYKDIKLISDKKFREREKYKQHDIF